MNLTKKIEKILNFDINPFKYSEEIQKAKYLLEETKKTQREFENSLNNYLLSKYPLPGINEN